MKRGYEQLGIVAFGEHLIETKDLDPVYTTLQGLMLSQSMDSAQVSRWMLAYWCFYSCGVACYLSELEGKAFWDGMKVAAANEEPTPFGTRWERGHERRHFRGENARKSLLHLTDNFLYPEDVIEFIGGVNYETDFADVNHRAQTITGFGPWIAWKIADMLNALGLYRVDFSRASRNMHRDPVKGAKMLWVETLASDNVEPTNEQAISWAVDLLKDSFRNLNVPHDPSRTIGLEEVETVLCKWKSHRNGHYPLGNDITEIRAGVLPWADTCLTARKFLSALPALLP